MKTSRRVCFGRPRGAVFFLCAVTVAVFLTAVSADAPAGVVSAGGYAGEGGSGLGLVEGMVQLVSVGRGVVLLHPRVTVFDEQQDFRLGAVYRLGFPSRPAARFTFNPRYDRQHMSGGSAFDLFSAFAEYRDPWFTARINGAYSPDGAELIEQVVTEERAPGGDRVRRTFERWRAPRKGIDGEAGVRLPLPGWEGPARILGGFYAYDADRVGRSSGWTGRLEYRPARFLALDVVAYMDRDRSDIDWFGGARVIFGFGGGDRGGDADLLELPPVQPLSSVVSGGLRENYDARVVLAPSRTHTTPPPAGEETPPETQNPVPPIEPMGPNWTFDPDGPGPTNPNI